MIIHSLSLGHAAVSGDKVWGFGYTHEAARASYAANIKRNGVGRPPNVVMLENVYATSYNPNPYGISTDDYQYLDGDRYRVDSEGNTVDNPIFFTVLQNVESEDGLSASYNWNEPNSGKKITSLMPSPYTTHAVETVQNSIPPKPRSGVQRFALIQHFTDKLIGLGIPQEEEAYITTLEKDAETLSKAYDKVGDEDVRRSIENILDNIQQIILDYCGDHGVTVE